MRAAWLGVNLGAYRRNLQRLREHCGGTPLLAVAKANAYGHGLVPIARTAEAAGCWGVGVALPEEGVALREAGLAGRLVVLGLWPMDQSSTVVRHDLDCVVSTEAAVTALAAAARRAPPRDGRARVHLKVDTGMTRVGVHHAEALSLARLILSRPELQLAGVMTHFASAEEADGEATGAQWRRFTRILRDIDPMQPEPYVRHAANSAAALWFPASHLDLVRAGLVTYGVPPADRPLPFVLEPVLSLRARLTQVNRVEAGRRVGYGGDYTTRRASVLGLAPIGYGDGFPWRAGGRAHALVQGRRVPVVGRISMDQVVLDVTDLPGVRPGEIATFVGRDGEEVIGVEELAEAAGTIRYEILTRFAERLHRVYHQGSCENEGESRAGVSRGNLQ